MPTYIEVNGLDEAGSVGEDIIFSRVSVGIDNEIQLFLRNIDFFDMLLPSKSKISRGYDPTYLLKYVTALIEDSTLEIELFKMFAPTQLQLTKDLLSFTAEDLFKQRKNLVDLFDPSGKLVQSENAKSSIFDIANIMKKFRTPKIWLDSFVKSYGMMTIVGQCANGLKTKVQRANNKGFSNLFSVYQLAGGYPFAFWWRTLLEKEYFQKGSFVMTGVSNGDEYYPTMSAAGNIASSLIKNKDKLHLFQ